ncbi:MAG: 3-isopropylmalate dehydrogenase [Bacteroidaceae bacterium]|nr:3-isopropylmalate dehydrogenase [Bacteroidaceae bacterium]
MNLHIAVLPGDGIGPEISEQGVAVVKAIAQKFNHQITFTSALVGGAAIDAVGHPFPEETYEVCRNADAVLFASVGDLKFDNDPHAKVRPEQGLLAMRKRLGLYANIRPIETFDCLIHQSPLREELVRGADFVCIRELTGGMYFGTKEEGDDAALDTCTYTRAEVERILHVAYTYAMRRRRHLTVVDKANVLATSRLWRKVALEVSAQYPEVKTDFMYVDNAAMRMIQEPTYFDVIVTENTFGDILTDEASCITGSMGLLPSASTGEGTPVFEPIHGSWPQAKGQNKANPLAQILSAAMLFDHFNLTDEANHIRRAVRASLDAHVRTPEIQVPNAPHYGTREVGEWIVNWILSNP